MNIFTNEKKLGEYGVNSVKLFFRHLLKHFMGDLCKTTISAFISITVIIFKAQKKKKKKKKKKVKR